MGEVYEAEDTKLERKVALKVLPAELARNPQRRERFEREAKAVAALNHPNIVTIYSVEEADGIPFLTMELVEGRSLSDLIPKGGMPLDRLLAVAWLTWIKVDPRFNSIRDDPRYRDLVRRMRIPE